MSDEELIIAIRASQDLEPKTSSELERIVKANVKASETISTIMESDKRTFTNQITDNGWLFDAIWRVKKILDGI